MVEPGSPPGSTAAGARAPRRVRYVADAVVTVDHQDRVLRPGALEVEGERIVWVGHPDDAPAVAGTQVRTLGGLLMPGLVNCHSHSAMTLLRSAGDGLSLQRWLQEVIWPQEAHLEPEDVYWGMALGCQELLACGVTTTCEMYRLDHALVDAAVDAGIRCVATPGILDVPDAGPQGRWEYFVDQARALHAKDHGRQGLITVGFGPHSAYALPPEGLVGAAEAAQQLDALLHIHVAENRHEGQGVLERDGCSVPGLLERLGVFEGRCLAAHSVWLDDEDLARYRAHGVAVAHCPGSNGKLGSGVARIRDMLAMGIEVGLGTDGPASNDDLDLWQEIRLAPLLARATSSDPDALRTGQALALATRGGAAALGLATGSLEPGRLADMVRLELDDSRMVPGIDAADLVAHLVWAGDRSLVTDVWVGGSQVVAKGVCHTVDAPEARRQVHRRARRLRQAAGA